MATTKKQQKRRKRQHDMIIVTKSYVPANETLFPEKVKKAEDALKKTKFIGGFLK